MVCRGRTMNDDYSRDKPPRRTFTIVLQVVDVAL